MQFDIGMEYIIQMIKSRNEELMYQRWLHGYHTSMPFDEFKDKLGADTPDMVRDERTAPEVVEDVISLLGV